MNSERNAPAERGACAMNTLEPLRSPPPKISLARQDEAPFAPEGEETKMDLGIAGRVALVSGGTKGIGRATADQFLKEGCKVVIVGRSAESLEDALGKLRKTSKDVAGVAADMTDLDGINIAVAFAQKTFGPPDIAISNVHLGGGEAAGEGSFDEVSDERYINGFKDMTMSVVHLTRAVIPHMKAQRWGRLVNIGSGSPKEPPMKMEHLLHNVVRAPVITLNKTLSFELGKYGITANTVATGWIETDAYAAFQKEMKVPEGKMFEYVSNIQYIPLGRFGRPEEEAGLIVFLCSELGGYITGAYIPVDGGKHVSAW
jgi:3-oxoacyl-[acyl-carrier protein] reductase